MPALARYDRPILARFRPALVPAATAHAPIRLLQFTLLNKADEIVRAADEHALHPDHRDRRPASPHLQAEPPAPLAEVAAVLEIGVLQAGRIKRPAGPSWIGVLPHADDHDVVRRHRR